MDEINYKALTKIQEMKPSEFAEKYLNIKLFNCQKRLLNILSKYLYCWKSKSNYRIKTYYKLCECLANMQENDVIRIYTLNGYEEMNREDFVNWIMTEWMKI